MGAVPKFDPNLVVFACSHSGAPAARTAGEVPEVHLIEVPCSGKVDVIHLLKAFEDGADGVLVLGCFKEACRYLEGNLRAAKRVGYVRSVLEEVGIEPERVQFQHLAPDMAQRFRELALQLAGKIRAMGPIPGKVKA
mgnify:CR=1 FL=1